MEEMDKVEVEWVDSCRVFFEWTEDPEDAIAEQENYSVIVHSIGYLAGDWPDQILLIRDNGHDQICGGMLIPRVAIRKITKLEETKLIPGRPFPAASSDDISVTLKK